MLHLFEDIEMPLVFTLYDMERNGIRAEGEALAEEMTLRDALSLFVARGCEVLPVVNAQGQPCGTLHFQDLLMEA